MATTTAKKKTTANLAVVDGGAQPPGPPSGTEEKVHVPPMRITRMVLKVKGISPLITHAWGEKAKKQMREKQQKLAKSAKEAKDPKADFEAAKYVVNGRDCVPSL